MPFNDVIQTSGLSLLPWMWCRSCQWGKPCCSYQCISPGSRFTWMLTLLSMFVLFSLHKELMDSYPFLMALLLPLFYHADRIPRLGLTRFWNVKEFILSGFSWKFNCTVCCIFLRESGGFALSCPELHWRCSGNSEQLLWHCGVRLCENRNVAATDG